MLLPELAKSRCLKQTFKEVCEILSVKYISFVDFKLSEVDLFI